MIIIEKPYISDFLKETLKQYQLPVLKTETAREMLGAGTYHFVEPGDVIARAGNGLHIYTPSENAIHWISENLQQSSLPEKINFFKDKYRFRQLTQHLFPEFKYREIDFNDLQTINVKDLFFPMILKPSVGFFSMGVYKVQNAEQWKVVVEQISHDLDLLKDLYPEAVLNTTRFIAEEIIEGEEYAIDAYFNSEGEAVMLGMMKHIFGSEDDVSDRVYFTSGEIISRNHDRFMAFIRELGELTGLKNFPLHVEIRVDDSGKIVPIEVNPLRFGGWCTSADLMYKAYGFNPYLYFCHERKPDWSAITQNNTDKVFSIIILDRPSDIPPASIKAFDYDRVLANFEKPLELRKVDYRKYPQFGFLFAETHKNNFKELLAILKSDLKEYIKY